VNHGLICAQWYGLFDGRHPVGDRLFPDCVMLVQARFKRRGSDLLERLDRGPPEQPIADEEGADVTKPLESLRNIGFQ
jgi:hypothetical protein